MTLCVGNGHFSRFELFVGPLIFCCCFALVTTLVFPDVVRPSNCLSDDCGASVLHDVERAIVGSSTVMEGRNNASESFSVATVSVVESVLDVESSGVVVSFVVASATMLADVDALRSQTEWLSVVSLTPEPVDICVGTTELLLRKMAL